MKLILCTPSCLYRHGSRLYWGLKVIYNNLFTQDHVLDMSNSLHSSQDRASHALALDFA